MVSLLGCLVNQPVGTRRIQCALDEEHVADVDSERLVGIPEDMLVVATVIQLPEVDIGVARVLGPDTSRIADDGTACVLVLVPPAAAVLSEDLELELELASERAHEPYDFAETARITVDLLAEGLRQFRLGEERIDRGMQPSRQVRRVTVLHGTHHPIAQLQLRFLEPPHGTVDVRMEVVPCTAERTLDEEPAVLRTLRLQPVVERTGDEQS
eukprot:scaffold111580_cov75-Phaeocystis_antarctica.AAC.3